jgi:acetoacetyl-CoA synthetase
MLVDVHLDELDLALRVADHLLEHRRELPARAAPRRPEVDQDRLSPRHVPNDVFQVAAIPRTLSGKKMELPVKKLLMGADPASVLKRDAMANADCVDWFIAHARERAQRSGSASAAAQA